MKTKIAPEKMLLWGLQGALVLFVIVAAYSATLHSRIDDMQDAIEMEKKATADTAASGKKIGDELRALKAKAAEADAKVAESDALKAALTRAQPAVGAALEAAAKAGKPDVRANLLAGAGVIAQIAGGARNEAAVAILDRALALDKSNCAAGLATQAAGKAVELGADCQPPAAAPAAPAAAPAAPAAAPAAAAPAPAAKH